MPQMLAGMMGAMGGAGAAGTAAAGGGAAAGAAGAGMAGGAAGAGAAAGSGALGAGAAAGSGAGGALAGGAAGAAGAPSFGGMIRDRIIGGFDPKTGEFDSTKMLFGEDFGQRVANDDDEKKMVEGLGPDDAVRALVVNRIMRGIGGMGGGSGA
jgi:hypothetical protein